MYKIEQQCIEVRPRKNDSKRAKSGEEISYNNLSSSFECAESSPSSLSPWCRRQASQHGHSQFPRTQCPIGLKSRFFSYKEGLQSHPVKEIVYVQGV